jgi:Rod binding domain-containing protein
MATTPKISSGAATPKPNALDDKSKQKLQRAVKEFESFFVGYMLKSMRSTVPKSEMMGDAFGGEMMEGMFDLELAKHISNNSNLGLGEMLYKKLTGEELPKDILRQSLLMPMISTQQRDAFRSKSNSLSVNPSESMQVRVNNYKDIIDAAAEKHGVDANLIKAVMAGESGGKPHARSSKNAKGLMQLIDSTAADMGVRNLWNPQENIFGGAKYLKQMLDKFQGSVPLALASYNAGPAAVEKHGGVPPIKETKDFVTRVMNYLHTFEQQELLDNGDN